MLCIMHGRSLCGVGMLLALYYIVHQVIPRSCIHINLLRAINEQRVESFLCCFPLPHLF